MESSLVAPVSGRVREVMASPNVQVAAGKPLIQIDPTEDGPAAEEGERVPFDAGEPDAGPTRLDRLRWLTLGYDVTAPEARRIVDAVLEAPLDTEGEHALLALYADVRGLNRPHAVEEPGVSGAGSPQEHMHAFLRSLDADAEGLPDRFVTHLGRALKHFGIDDLERTPGARGRRLPALPRPAARGHRAPGGAEAAEPAPRPRRGALRRRGRRAARGARPPRVCAGAARARPRRARPRAALARLRPAGHRGGPRGDLCQRARQPRGTRRRPRHRPRGAPASAGRLRAAARAPADRGHGRRDARGADAALLPHPPARGPRPAHARRRPVPAQLL